MGSKRTGRRQTFLLLGIRILSFSRKISQELKKRSLPRHTSFTGLLTAPGWVGRTKTSPLPGGTGRRISSSLLHLELGLSPRFLGLFFHSHGDSWLLVFPYTMSSLSCVVLRLGFLLRVGFFCALPKSIQRLNRATCAVRGFPSRAFRPACHLGLCA